MVVVLLVIMVLACLTVFYRLWAPFGGIVRGARGAVVHTSVHYGRKAFANLIATPMYFTLQDAHTMLFEQLRGAPGRRPRQDLVADKPDLQTFASGSDTRFIWLGHSSFLLRMGGKNLLLDPVLSRRASPFQSIGPKRFSDPSLDVSELPDIDAVVISHDHYDHLDYGTVRQLRDKAKRFFVPLGVGAHLERWGVRHDAITELDWWDTAELDGLELVCAPARHFSGRRLGDRNATLWGSWIIQTPQERLFFSGDTGYGPHFAEIGKRYGPFDVTLMECGQYDRRWANVHMLPEQTVEAARELGSKLFVPIHWGAFVLAFHAWTEPVERALKAASKQALPVVTPRLGQVVRLRDGAQKTAAWWTQAVETDHVPVGLR
ncbi:MAG TPA: MBL fold metallo-hydrolase [Candidatus Saccharimonadales bacterium]|nr:MBL fold metallo-hydrolase [Candidatus Saccharimonadales bacterium]